MLPHLRYCGEKEAFARWIREIDIAVDPAPSQEIAMRRPARLLAPTLLLVLGLASCDERRPSPTSIDGPALSVVPVSDGGTVDLIADQTLDVGDVSVTDTRTELTVDIEMQDGWCLDELHIDAGETEGDIPQTAAGAPIPGQFQVGETLPCASGISRTLGLPDGLEVAVAVHAVVRKADRVASAWADGSLFVDPGNWATFTVAFEGSGEDEEDGTLTGGALEWSSDLDGTLGTGETITTSSLTAGTHAVTLTATDSEGATDTDEISITVEETAGETLAYVANQRLNTVSVVDVATNAVTETIPVGASPLRIAVTPDGSTAYVVNLGTDDVSVIDVATHSVTETIPAGDGPNGIAISPDGSTAYVVNAFSDDVSVVDVETNSVTGTIAVGNQPLRVAFGPDGTTAYVTRSFSDDVSVIDVATGSVTTSIPVGARPRDIALSPDGSVAYVTNSSSSTVSVIDVATNSVEPSIPVGFSPGNVAFTPDGSTAYVAGSVDVSVIDVSAASVTATVSQGGGFGVAVTPDGSTAYLSVGYLNSVALIDVNTNTTAGTIDVGGTPVGIAFIP